MKPSLVAFLSIASLLITGCATSDDRIRETNAHLKGATPCCSSVADFAYTPLSFGESKDLKLTHKSPVFVFPEGIAMFASLSLPNPGQQGRLLDFSSDLNGYLKGATFLDPVFLFLDKDRKVIGQQADVPLFYGLKHPWASGHL